MKRTFIMTCLLFAVVDLLGQSPISAVCLDSTARVLNTIIYKNPKLLPVTRGALVTYTATDFLIAGKGNLRLLSTPFISGYRINSSSPAYNQGSAVNMRPSDSLDLDYLLRLRCGQIDMGAYEFQALETEIVESPSPQHVCEGTSMLLRVVSQGSNMSYQWQRNGENLIGKISATLPLSGAVSDSGMYRVIVYGDCCSDTSDWVSVRVDARPQLEVMADTTILSGSDVTLSVRSLVGTMLWYESDYTTLVLDSVRRNITQTVQYIGIAKNGRCPMEVADEVTITVSGLPCHVQAKPDTSLCLGDAYRLVVESATVDYRWFDMGTDQELPKFSLVRPVDTLVLLLRGEDDLGGRCADTLTLSVRKIALEAMDDLSLCSGVEVLLTSVPPADDWYTLEGVRVGSGNHVKVYPPMNTTSLYIAHRSDGICFVTDTVKVFANPPDLRILFSDTTLCEGDTLHLQTNKESHLVQWKLRSTGEDLGSDPMIRVWQSEIYEAWVYDAFCGDIFAEVAVNVQDQPHFSVVDFDVVCQRTSVWLSSTPNASYWRLEDGTRVENPLVAEQSQSYVGVYHEGVCTVYDTLELRVQALPHFIARPDTSIREGQSVLLWSQEEASYWRSLDSPEPLASLIVTPQSTTYYVAVLETPICGSLFDTVKIEVMPVDTFALVLEYEAGCGDGQGWAKVSVAGETVGANNTYQYVWSTGATDSVITHLSAGTYAVTVTNSRGVSVRGSFILDSVSPLLISFSMEEPVDENCSGGLILTHVSGGTPDYRYQWNQGSMSKDLLNISAGIYQLQVSDSKGCTAQAEVRLRCFYKRVMPTLFITPNGDGKNDYLDIKNIEHYPNNTVVIINSYGDEIIQLKNYNNRDVIWDGRNRKGEKIPDGIYYYIIEAEGVDNMAGWLMMKLSKSR